MAILTVATVQTKDRGSVVANVDHIEERIRDAAKKGAQIIVTPELFETAYFCKTQQIAHFSMASEVTGHPTLKRMQALAQELSVVLPVSFFERSGPHFYNSVAMFDVTGELLGTYRKSHIPDGPGYQEKYYFRPGDTGLQVWSTAVGRIGVGICWDQWFPEVARELVLSGADILVYPTAIGAEPKSPDLDTKDMWQRAMAGHAACNLVPIVAANRIGNEDGQVFYGSSFICNHFGEKIAELPRDEEGVATANVDIDEAKIERSAFGFFRDRRPELYPELARVIRTSARQL